MITKTTRRLLRELVSALGMARDGSAEGASSGARRVLIAVSGGVNAPAAVEVLPALGRPPHEITAFHARRPGRAPRPAAVRSAIAWIERSAPVTARELETDDP